MADVCQVITGNALLKTGKGQVTGVILTKDTTTAALVTFYNNTTNSGTKIFEAYVSAYSPVIIFFHDSYSPRFTIGLYVVLPTGITATFWTRKIA